MRLTKKSLSIIRREGISSLIIRAVRKVYFENKITKNIHRSPTICKLSWIIYSNTIRTTVKLLNKAHPEKYTDSDPFKLIYVSPHRVNRLAKLDEKYYSRSIRYGRVIEQLKKQNRTHEEIIDINELKLFGEDKIDWQDTNFPKMFKKRDNWLASENLRKEHLKTLYKNLEKEGYKTQTEIFSENPKEALNSCNDAFLPFTNEIRVAIDSNGDLFKLSGGRHRLAISKALNLERVPILVMCRHREWQKVRNNVREGSAIPNEFSNHPDLRDLRNLS